MQQVFCGGHQLGVHFVLSYHTAVYFYVAPVTECGCLNILPVKFFSECQCKLFFSIFLSEDLRGFDILIPNLIQGEIKYKLFLCTEM